MLKRKFDRMRRFTQSVSRRVIANLQPTDGNCSRRLILQEVLRLNFESKKSKLKEH